MTTQFGSGANVHAGSAYEMSFGSMPEETIYAGGVTKAQYKYNDQRGKLCKAQAAKIQKDRQTGTDEYASGTSYSSTSGNLNVLIPIYVDNQIVDLVRKETPLFEMLQKRAVRGKTYDWNQHSALNSAAFRLEAAPQPVSDDTYVRQVTPLKYAYAIGKVTGVMQAASAGYIDMLRQEVMTHTRALIQLLEQTILTGDASTNAEEFSGFNTLISTNTIAVSAALDIDNLRLGIRQARQGAQSSVVGGGNPDLIVMDLATHDQFKGLLQSYLRYVAPQVSIAWGIQVIEFEGLPVITSKFANITSGSRRVYILDTSRVFLAVLQDVTFEDLAKVDDSNKFMLKWYGALIISAEAHCAMLTGITD